MGAGVASLGTGIAQPAKPVSAELPAATANEEGCSSANRSGFNPVRGCPCAGSGGLISQDRLSGSSGGSLESP